MSVRLMVVLSAIALYSCKESGESCAFQPDVEGISIDVQWQSLEDSIASITSKRQLVDLLTNHPLLRDVMLNRPGYPSDSVFINEVFARFTNPHIDTLVMEVHRVFGDGSELRQEFVSAFKNFRHYYPDFIPPRIETVITGLETDLFVTDSVIVIGLDHYLGPDSKYPLNHLYEYLRKKYSKEFIVPSTMLLFGIDERFNNFNPSDQSVLSEMISYGKAYHFAKHMVPCTPDSVLIAYTAEEIRGSREYESLIWSRFIEDEVLFSTSREDKKRYILERPKTIEVGEKCPGRIGQWVGWQIVRTYADTHPDQTLPQIMKMNDASKLFRESGYKPQVVQLKQGEKI
jgi:hypothetical protein